MVKFTTSDFLSSSGSTTFTTPRKRPARLIIPAMLPRPPMLTRSLPIEDLKCPPDTEPFPEFKIIPDIDPVNNPVGPHCSLHCHHLICKLFVRKSDPKPPCWCASEITQTVDFASPMPEPALTRNILKTLRGVGDDANSTPNKEVEVHLSDMEAMLHHVEDYVKKHGRKSTHMIQQLEAIFPGNVPNGIKFITGIFFFDIRVYFARTLRDIGSRTLTIAQLRTEVNVYVWTGMRTFTSEMCNQAVQERLRGHDPRTFLTRCGNGPLGVVSAFWQECADEVVGLIVWRDAEIRKYEEAEKAGEEKAGEEKAGEEKAGEEKAGEEKAGEEKAQNAEEMAKKAQEKAAADV